MANEITVSVRLENNNGNLRFLANPGSLSFDQATARAGTPGIVSVTTAAAAVTFTPITPGFVYLRNLSTGTTIAVRTTGADDFATLKGSWPAIIPKSTGGWLVRCTTAGGTADLDVRGVST